VPDVAGDADPDSGYRIVTGGQTGIIGGTSAAAPLWAGIAALLNANGGRSIGQPHAKLYGDPTALRDIVTGDNKSGSLGFAASAGWDACTGLGSPNGAKLFSVFGQNPALPERSTSPRTTLFQLTGLDGSPVLVTVDSIYRLRASVPSEGPPATKVEYGSGYLFTHEPISHLIVRIGAADRLVRLTTRSGAPVYLNEAAISSVRPALPVNGPGTEIVVAGQYQHVMESIAEVQHLLA
jgi:hypothetical protein